MNDPTLADAILDRLIQNAHIIEMEGESMRKNSSDCIKESMLLTILCRRRYAPIKWTESSEQVDEIVGIHIY